MTDREWARGLTFKGIPIEWDEAVEIPDGVLRLCDMCAFKTTHGNKMVIHYFREHLIGYGGPKPPREEGT